MKTSKYVQEILEDIKNNPTNWKHKDRHSREIETSNLGGKKILITSIGNFALLSIIDVIINDNIVPATTYTDRYKLEKAYYKWCENINIHSL